ncbi:MAG: DUF2780 domain-containing protein [Acidobacteriota bacterium]
MRQSIGALKAVKQMEMEMMDEFVKRVSQELGEDEGTTRAATASLLEALREQAAKDDFDRLISALPGAEALLHTHAAETVEKNQNGLAGALGWIRGWTGGTSGDVAFLAALSEAGFSEIGVAQFINSFKKFAATHAGEDAVKKVFAAAPDLEILAQRSNTAAS